MVLAPLPVVAPPAALLHRGGGGGGGGGGASATTTGVLRGRGRGWGRGGAGSAVFGSKALTLAALDSIIIIINNNNNNGGVRCVRLQGAHARPSFAFEGRLGLRFEAILRVLVLSPPPRPVGWGGEGGGGEGGGSSVEGRGSVGSGRGA